MPELMTVPTAAERHALCERLAPLLARRIALYTAHESSSVPVETARALLDGILLHLGLAGTSADPAARASTVLGGDASDLLARGERETRRAALHAYARWQQLVRALPPLESCTLRETLASIGRGFRHYDARFFPQEFPCEIDYPLERPVSEDLQGVHYVNQYLAQLAAELTLLRALSVGEVRGVLDRGGADWRGLPIGLFAPVAANALARSLLGGEGLGFTAEERCALARRFAPLTPAQLARMFHDAAEEVAARHSLAPLAAETLRRCADDTAARVAALRDTSGLAGLFP